LTPLPLAAALGRSQRRLQRQGYQVRTHEVDIDHPAKAFRRELSCFVQDDSRRIDEGGYIREIFRKCRDRQVIRDVERDKLHSRRQVAVLIESAAYDAITRCRKLLRGAAPDPCSTARHDCQLFHRPGLRLFVRRAMILGRAQPGSQPY
jgi:hypothetical protein